LLCLSFWSSTIEPGGPISCYSCSPASCFLYTPQQPWG
jgi:hypothetical protein